MSTNNMSNISDLDCKFVNNFTSAVQKCDFVKNNTECQDVDGYINYVQTLYCNFEGAGEAGGIMVYVVWLGVLFIGLATAADDFLCPNLESISKTLR